MLKLLELHYCKSFWKLNSKPIVVTASAIQALCLRPEV